MSVEKLTPEEKAKAEKAKEDCEKAKRERAKQELAAKLEEGNQFLQKQLESIAAVPFDALSKIEEVKDQIMELLTGLSNPKKKTWSGSEIIDSINDNMSSLADNLSSLKIDQIPGLKMIPSTFNCIKDLFKLIKASIKSSSQKDSNGFPDIPSALLVILNELMAEIQTICIQLSLFIETLILKMIQIVLKVLIDIQKILQASLGLDIFPLNAIPKAIETLSQIISFVQNAPETIDNNIKAALYRTMEGIRNNAIAPAQAALTSPSIPIPCTVPTEQQKKENKNVKVESRFLKNNDIDAVKNDWSMFLDGFSD